MPYFAHTNDEVSQFLQSRKGSSLHITGSEKDHTGAETISLSRLNSVLLYEPEEMIICVQAGIKLHDLQKILHERNQWIPTLTAEESLEETLGAAVAMDHFHPRAKNLGMLRTAILGGTFCTTDGEIFKSGSRVVKSVAGYDIHRAFCGSRGKFGIILSLTLKVQPKPEITCRFLAPIEIQEKLLRFHPVCLESFEGKLLTEFAGFKEDLENDIAEFDFGIEKLDDEKWNNIIKDLIQSRNKKESLSADAEELLKKVHRVFDPEGVLV